jgi:RNA polymerase-binding transcription factor DksA
MAQRKNCSRLSAKQLQEFANLLMQERRAPHGFDVLREIDEALERIQNGTYGVCLGTGKRIDKRRLLAIPWAKYSIEYAKLMEEQHGSMGSQAEYYEDLDGPYAA